MVLIANAVGFAHFKGQLYNQQLVEFQNADFIKTQKWCDCESVTRPLPVRTQYTPKKSQANPAAWIAAGHCFFGGGGGNRTRVQIWA